MKVGKWMLFLKMLLEIILITLLWIAPLAISLIIINGNAIEAPKPPHKINKHKL